jgi:FtsP/CotA-like multicopper oxidase with cupredoxin domain
MAYWFVPPDAGTCWHHSRYFSYEQIAHCLIGPLIFEGGTPLGVDHDITVLTSDWLADEGSSLVDKFANMDSIAQAGDLGNLYWLDEVQLARLRPNIPKSHCVPRAGDGRVLSGIIFTNREGLRWRGTPKE